MFGNFDISECKLMWFNCIGLNSRKNTDTKHFTSSVRPMDHLSEHSGSLVWHNNTLLHSCFKRNTSLQIAHVALWSFTMEEPLQTMVIHPRESWYLPKIHNRILWSFQAPEGTTSSQRNVSRWSNMSQKEQNVSLEGRSKLVCYRNS